MRDTPFQEQPCPHCGAQLHGALHPGDLVAQPGDLGLCAECGELHEYGPRLELIQPGEQALLGIDLIEMQAVRSIWKSYKSGKMRKRLPTTPDEWQVAVDMAEGALMLDSARQYGLVTGGPKVNVNRCVEILDEAKARGIMPSTDAVERFVAATVNVS